jgi:hypothetical protein
MPSHTREQLDRAHEAFAAVKARYEIPEFDPDDLPVAESEDWSWIDPNRGQPAA